MDHGWIVTLARFQPGCDSSLLPPSPPVDYIWLYSVSTYVYVRLFVDTASRILSACALCLYKTLWQRGEPFACSRLTEGILAPLETTMDGMVGMDGGMHDMAGSGMAHDMHHDGDGGMDNMTGHDMMGHDMMGHDMTGHGMHNMTTDMHMMMMVSFN